MGAGGRSATKAVDRFGVRAERWFNEFWPDVANYLGTIALAAAGVVGVIFPEPPDSEQATASTAAPTPSPSTGEVEAAAISWPFSAVATWTVALLVSGAILVLIGYLGSRRRRTTAHKLSGRAETAEADLDEHAAGLESVLRAMLVGLLHELNIYRDDTRASIYARDGESFVRLARVSKNPVLKAGGRPSYPADQGVIGLAWREGKASLTNLPEDRADWEAKMVEYGLSAEDAQGLRMHCKSIVALRVDGPGPEFDSLAIVVYESEAKRGVHGTTIDHTRELDGWKILTAAIANMRDSIDAVARVKHAADDSNRR
ncbi:hypothetical protein Q9S36_20060 [Microbacterium sp. ARD31]|uniref:hypothetical protein n=1 Tax=Microbacterium sp. ARD31 TaxID=2962576 RepID=UPI0028829DB7|nr:hypothetical protein [Microbacterium sp. ARD31]MDT0182475.1 hypothetical protein [Microbacterium sp. ARD31]